MTADPPMTLETALIRAGYILDRYRDQPPTVLRVINCYDVEAIAVLVRVAEAARPLIREPGPEVTSEQ